jgi:preprotein translocase subunit YajC
MGGNNMPGGSGYSSIIIFAVIIVAFYFLLIRPESKRKKQVTQMRSELAVGDEITTIGGITGVVCGIKNDLITIESGEDRVRIQIMRWAISSRGPVDVPAPAAASTEKTEEKKKFSLFGKKKDEE